MANMASAFDYKTPYYDTIINLGIPANGEVTQASMATWDPYTPNLNVPKEAADSIAGFNTGFGISATVAEQGITLDSIQITEMKYSLHHLDVVTGNETPVLRTDGSQQTDIHVTSFNNEANGNNPSVFTTTRGNQELNGDINSPNNSPITTTIENFGVLFVTKHNFVFGSSPDFTQPTLNHGYIVRWNISFIPTHKGITYPEVTLHPQFKYLVKDIKFPQMKKLVPLIQDSSEWSEQGVVLQMYGEELEFFKLQRSTDLEHWTDWGFDEEGGNWVAPFDVPYSGDREGFISNTYEWVMFDKAFPSERRMPAKEFYRMVWTGRKGTWKIAQYPATP